MVSFSVLENKQVRRSFFFQCSLCHKINLLLTKLVRSRWLGIGLVLSLRAKRELGQYPAILTSRLVNNIHFQLEVEKILALKVVLSANVILNGIPIHQVHYIFVISNYCILVFQHLIFLILFMRNQNLHVSFVTSMSS